MSAEPQKGEAKSSEDDQDAWEREQAAEEQKLLDERVGMLVADRYRIVRTLGAGGMGGVYEAEHELIGKRVALKCLHREYSRDRDLVERFKREARAATAIGNEHIVDVTDMGDLPDGAPFLVMEVLQGQTLNDLIEEGGAMPIRRAVHIARQVCDALGAAHAKGIVHRDLKPENIFLIKRGGDPDFVKVLDFGISKMHGGDRKDRGLTRTGMAIGTPTYMSPEQAQGLRDVDQRTDIWALGVIIYEMLTGRRPFDADSYPMLLMKIVGAEPERVLKWRKDVPEPLDTLVMRCLEKPVGTRMQSMADLEAGLADFSDVDRAPDLFEEDQRGGPKDRASRTIARGKRASQPESPEDDAARKGNAATQLVASSRPPPNEAPSKSSSGVRSAGGTAVGGTFDAQKAPASAATAEARNVPPEEKTPPVATTAKSVGKAAPAAPTAEIGSVVRAPQQRTSEIGSVTRPARASDAAEAGLSDAGDVQLPQRSNTPMLVGAGVVALLAVAGIGWALGGAGSTPPVTPPEPIATAPVVPPPTVPTPTSVPTPATPPTAPAAPTEVRVRIQVMPIDARITINDVEFPNPMDALQTRSLTPTRIRAERDGYRTLEQLVIFDTDQNFHFILSRGGGVQHVGLGGPGGAGEPAPEGGHDTPRPHGETPTPSGTGGGFRDEF